MDEVFLYRHEQRRRRALWKEWPEVEGLRLPPGERYWGTSGIAAPGKGPGWIGEVKLSNSYRPRIALRLDRGYI
jgi:hypothetical protein